MHAEQHKEIGKPLDYLRLVRIWNLPTAIADSFAGYLLVDRSLDITARLGEHETRLLGVMLISALIYAAGMVWNDIFDAERDKTLHPDRPIPSDAIDRGIAIRFGLGLVAAGLFVSLLVGLHVLLLTMVLVALTFIYNGWLKHHGFVGCLAMGSCRFVNMWLGIAAAGGWLGPAPIEQQELTGNLLTFPATLGLYVTAVTLLSLLEESKIGRWGFYSVIGVLLATLLPLAAITMMVHFKAPLLGDEPQSWVSLVPLTTLVVWLIVTAVPVGRHMSAGTIGGVVRTALTGIILLDSAMLFVRDSQLAGAMCALLVVPAIVMIRLIARRPSTAPV